MQIKWQTLAAMMLLTGMNVTHQPVHAQGKLSAPTLRKHKMTTAQTPSLLACNMGAMTKEQRQRHDQIAEQLRRATKQVKELPDGYAFRYASTPALFMAAAEFITLESRCCSFYHFSLEQEREDGPMWLRVTGTPDAKSFIKPVLAP